MRNEREKPSIKRDIKDFLLISNCCFLTLISVLSLIIENKIVTMTGFSFTLINVIASVIFYNGRIRRYQRSPE